MIGDRLKGKVAVITGGASGIGQACAVRFAEEGADIVVADLQPGDATVRLVEELGRKAIAVKVDTTSEADCDNMIAEAVRQFGHVDVGVMCAGAGLRIVGKPGAITPPLNFFGMRVGGAIGPTSLAAKAIVGSGLGLSASCLANSARSFSHSAFCSPLSRSGSFSGCSPICRSDNSAI